MQYKVGDVIKVKWIDSVGQGHWVHFTDENPEHIKPMTIISYGEVLEATPEHIRISSSIAEDRSQHCNWMAIPTCVIQEIKILVSQN